MPTAIIVGAGIGGLAAGISLQRAGWNVRIYEQASNARELGFGLGLAPNALAALEELGVADPVVRAGARLARVEVRRPDGRRLRRFNVPVGFPAIVALRADLHGSLVSAFGSDGLRLGAAVSFSERGEQVIARFADGSTDTGDFLVGADGVNSIIRHQLHPDEPAARPSAFCAVRGVVYGMVEHLGELSGVGYFGDAVEAATIRASRDAIYWYMSLRTEDISSSDASLIVREAACGFEVSFRAIIAATKSEDMRFDRLYERDPSAAWGIGRATLLGDAAHPVLPHTGQGAAQALEDAVALGLSISGSDNVEEALRRYERVRSRRTRAFVKLGPRIARVTTTRNGLISALRSAGLRWIPEAILGLTVRQLNFDPHRELRTVHTT